LINPKGNTPKKVFIFLERTSHEKSLLFRQVRIGKVEKVGRLRWKEVGENFIVTPLKRR